LSGNRVQHRRLKSRHVSGASTDFARNVFNYGEAAARHIATAKAMPKVRNAMSEMREQLKDYQHKDREDLGRVFNEVSKRVENGTIEPNEAPKWVKDILAISYFTRLASPAYSIINFLQVATVTAPILNGKFGAVRGTTALNDAYADVGLGDNVIAGVMNTARAARQWSKANLLNTTDVVADTLKRVAKLKDGADLVKMLNELIAGNAISLESGFEIGSAVSEGRGKIGTTIAKFDRITRQLPQVVENINRTVTAIAAYRLARTLPGYTHEKAVQFAFDTVKTTQGDYSSGNAPRFFNHPWLRPAMQFRKYAQMITYVLADATYRSFKGATREEKLIARKQLGHLLATQIAVAGTLSLPGLEIAKLAFVATAALGLTGTWDDQEDKLREWAEETFGKTLGEVITSGGIRLLNIDVTSRMSMSDLWTFGTPDKNDYANVMTWLFEQAVGSPGTTVFEFFDGLEDVTRGEIVKGAAKMIPVKAARDALTAYDRLSSGKNALTDAALKVVGFTSANQARGQEETSKSIRASQNEEAAGEALANEYRNAMSLGERARVRAKILAFNKTAKSYKHKVPFKSIDKYRNQDYKKTNPAPKYGVTAPKVEQKVTPPKPVDQPIEKLDKQSQAPAVADTRMAEIEETMKSIVTLVGKTISTIQTPVKVRIVRDPETGLATAVESA
jgi:hypothetical protein